MNKRKKKLILYIGGIPILVILFILLVSCILSPQPVHAMMVGFSEMTKYENKIYIEQGISENTKEELLLEYKRSRTKILEYYDEIRSMPTIIFVQTPEALKRYAKNKTGQTYYMYWGNYIVIGPNGFNEDVIAHELMHSELRERIKNRNFVPVWFDEGLAALVDDRYSINNNDKADNEKLEGLKNKEVFYNPSRSGENYQTAKSEVHTWYEKSGKAGLNMLIDGLNNGVLFNELYDGVE